MTTDTGWTYTNVNRRLRPEAEYGRLSDQSAEDWRVSQRAHSGALRGRGRDRERGSPALSESVEGDVWGSRAAPFPETTLLDGLESTD